MNNRATQLKFLCLPIAHIAHNCIFWRIRTLNCLVAARKLHNIVCTAEWLYYSVLYIYYSVLMAQSIA